MSSNTFLVSDESENSHGFTVKTEGIDTTQFLKNPIMFFMHERTNVIGKWENLKIEDGKMYADAVFDTDSPLGKEIALKVDKGFLKSASIGVKYNEEDLVNNVLEKCVLMEISIVDIGSNPNALKLYNAEQFTELFFNSIEETSELADILELKSPNHSLILSSIKNLKKEYTNLVNFKQEELQEREEEMNEMINFAIQRKALTQNLIEMQKQLFQKDYHKAKKELQELILSTYPIKSFSFAKMMQDAQKKEKEVLKEKGSLITLDDYRKYAPELLEQDPELYKRLLNETNFK